MNINISKQGFVSGSDLLNPVAFAGEMNSRVISITHPLFENSFYQLIIIKEKRPYVLGIDDGRVILPPSLTDIAGILECQFSALRRNESIDLQESNCDCYPQSSNDCSHLVFKSDKFCLKVAEGLSLNGLSPIPPFETIVDMYNNIQRAKNSVEIAKSNNEQVADSIAEKINDLQQLGYVVNLQSEIQNREMMDEVLQRQIDALNGQVKDNIDILIETNLHGNAIRQNNNIILTSSTHIDTTFILPTNITLTIPVGLTLTLDSNINVNGKLIVFGLVNILDSNSLNIIGELVCQDIKTNITFDSLNAKMIITSNSTVYTNIDIEIFGNNSFSIEEQSILEYYNKFDNEQYNLRGNATLLTDLILNNESQLNINGNLINESANIFINDNAGIKLNTFSILTNMKVIQLSIFDKLIGTDTTSEIHNYGTIPGLSSDSIYYFFNNEWVLKN